MTLMTPRFLTYTPGQTIGPFFESRGHGRWHVFGHAESKVTLRRPNGDAMDGSVEKFRREDVNLEE